MGEHSETETQPPIADYGVIGNGHTAALVSRHGSIDWCCLPRFDSGAVFCRLVDAERGGCFSLRPIGDHEVARTYDGHTNVLRTTFTTGTGSVRLTDFMPAPSRDRGDRVYPHRLLRRLEAVEGHVKMALRFVPSFDFARSAAAFDLDHGGVSAHCDAHALRLDASCRLGRIEGGVAGVVDISRQHDACAWFVLTYHAPGDPPPRLDAAGAEAELRRTLRHWRFWAARCPYDGPRQDLVLRSALALELLVYQPTGALIAAPTTSLPTDIGRDGRHLGGARNWDYRYAWLRDSGSVLDALQSLGYHDEAVRFVDWLEKHDGGEPDELRVMYTVDGERTPDERELEHLAGFRGCAPVRIGNGATDQVQTDAAGHILEAAVLCFESTAREVHDETWQFLCALADYTARIWQSAGHGPWEIRGPERHYVYSKVYSYVGLDRLARLARDRGLGGDVARWEEARDAVRAEVLERAYDRELGAFTQTYEGADLDASALLVGITGLVDPRDERFRSTIAAVERELSPAEGLLYRYRMDDGLPGADATFTLCGFWLVIALALSGQSDAARRHFDALCAHTNDLGLLSEQIDPETGALLGNFPQGFSHLGLITAAVALLRSRND